MISSEVQRTLVKSPPELWAELSDPAALARHLGELGEIRITRTEPEKLVEWEADGITGTVQIKPSGWGTKVTLCVAREVALADVVTEAESEHDDEPAAKVAAEPATDTQPEPEGAEQLEVEPETEPEGMAIAPEEPVDVEEPVDMESAAIAQEITDAEVSVEKTATADSSEAGPAPKPRHGFFARLFGRRRQMPAAPGEHASVVARSVANTPAEDAPPAVDRPVVEETSASPEPEPTGSAIESLQARFQADAATVTVDQDTSVSEPAAPEAQATAQAAEQPQTSPTPSAAPPEPDVDTSPEADADAEPAHDLAAELRAAEEVAVEEVTAVLTAVLDRLGAAHHRPFSRS